MVQSYFHWAVSLPGRSRSLLVSIVYLTLNVQGLVVGNVRRGDNRAKWLDSDYRRLVPGPKGVIFLPPHNAQVTRCSTNCPYRANGPSKATALAVRIFLEAVSTCQIRAPVMLRSFDLVPVEHTFVFVSSGIRLNLPAAQKEASDFAKRENLVDKSIKNPI